MVEYDFHEAHKTYPNLNGQYFRLNKINEIKDYFVAEIKERGSIIKRLSKYIACSDNFLINCFICNNRQYFYCIIATVIGAPIGMASASFSVAFSIFTGMVKNC